MIYAEFSEGDIYLHDTPEGAWICCGCRLQPVITTSLYGEIFKISDNKRISTLEEVEDHVYEHLNKGHVIPSRCLKRIEDELDPRWRGP
jgi:hypothetical protein